MQVNLVDLCIKSEYTVYKSLDSTNCNLVPFSCSSRFTPKNLHQRPTVALLCGPHVQGAQGISCGRHLANHEVEVILFLPNFVKMLDSVTSELTLFGKTVGKQVSSIKGEILFVFCFFVFFHVFHFVVSSSSVFFGCFSFSV